MTVNHHENNIVNDVVHSFGESVSHEYLEQFIGKPPVNQNHILVLLRMLKHTNKSEETIHQLILTTLLVQSALDTHEKVIKHGLGTSDTKTKQQLTVLGGDFYSSLYYYILSRSGDAGLIRALAKGIQDINEAKMSIYNSSRKQEPTVKDLRTLYSALAVRLAEGFDLTAWIQPLESYFLICGLQADLDQLEYDGGFGLAALYYEKTGSSNFARERRQIIQALNEAITEECGRFQLILSKNGISNDTFPALFWRDVEINDIHQKTCAAEEG